MEATHKTNDLMMCLALLLQAPSEAPCWRSAELPSLSHASAAAPCAQRTSRCFGAITLIALIALFACTCPFVRPELSYASPEFVAAQAAENATFVSSEGIVDGQTEPLGTQLTFKVLEESENGEPGTAQVGNGSVAALDLSYDGAVIIPEFVEHGGNTYRIVYCGANSFKASRVSNVTLPSTLVRVCSYAFYCCYNLKGIGFQGTPRLKYIEGHAFEVPNATGVLASIRFPESLLSVGVYSFAGQSALTTLEFEGKSLQLIGQYAFSNCKNLVEAHIPELTAATSSLGAYCFAGCSKLAFVEFCGRVASVPEELIGTRFFDDCGNLSTVVYRNKKVIPSWKNYGSSTDLHFEFTASNPTLYYTIAYYASQEDAEAGANALGSVCVRSDIKLDSIASGMERADELGLTVFDGEPLAPPAGYDAWYYEGGPSPTSTLSDSLYAFPVNSHDLTYASVALDAQTYPFTGKAVMPQPSVHAANGSALSPQTDYSLSYERQIADDTWAVDEECIQIGQMRVTLTGHGAYEGTRSIGYEIAHAQEGDTFTSAGVTYLVTTATDGTFVGQASVGNGQDLAVASDTTGTLTIPKVVKPDDSDVEYQVTAISKYAFGGSSSSSACTKLQSVTLPEGVASIDTYAFGHCSKLKTMKLPKSVTTIGSRAFQNCTALSELSFGASKLELLGTYCFANCTSLSSISIPSVKTFRDNVFSNCKRLVRVDFLATPPQGDATQFKGCARLARVVYHTTGTYKGSFPTTPFIYAIANFKDPSGNQLGQAVLKTGTPLASVQEGIGKACLLEGNVPALPSEFGFWRISGSSDSVFTKCCTLMPAGLANGKQKAGGSGAAKATYRIVSNNKRTAAYQCALSASKTKATIPATVKINDCTYTITKVAAKAFKRSKVTTVTVKSKTLTTLNKAFSLSKVKKVIAPKAKKAAYKKLLTKKACGRTVKVTWK